MTRVHVWAGAALVAFALTGGRAAAAPIVLDDFNTEGALAPPGVSQGPANGTTTFGPNTIANATFGPLSRSGTLTKISGPANGNPSVRLQIAGGNLQYQSSNNTTGSYTLKYDPATNTIGNTTSVLFDFQALGQNESVTITVDLVNGSNVVTATGMGSVTGGNAQTQLTVPITPGMGFNASQVDFLRITATPGESDNFSLGTVTVNGDFGPTVVTPVPEPATLTTFGLLLAGGAGVGAWRKRRGAPAAA